MINTSESEGECGAILEAFTQEIPVIARNNPGNANLITHAHTGWLFDTPEECIGLLSDIQKQSDERRKSAIMNEVTRNAKLFIQETHSEVAETSRYRVIISGALVS